MERRRQSDSNGRRPCRSTRIFAGLLTHVQLFSGCYFGSQAQLARPTMALIRHDATKVLKELGANIQAPKQAKHAGKGHAGAISPDLKRYEVCNCAVQLAIKETSFLQERDELYG
eukprot:1160334-Pelagomonas_calceolata.AAC.2